MRRYRGLGEVRRVGLFVLVALVGILLAGAAEQTTAGLDRDVADLVATLPSGVVVAVLAALQVVLLALVVGAPILLLVTRQLGAVGRGALAIVLGPVVLALVELVLDIPAPQPVAPDDVVVSDWPSTSVLAAYAAVAAVLGPTLRRRWRRAIWALLLVLAVVRVATATSAPVDLVLAIGVGGVVGSALVLALGRTGRELTSRGVELALATTADGVADVVPVEGSTDFRAQGPDGPLTVTVIDEDRWHRERLGRAYRRARLRDVGDQTWYRTPEQAVVAEAMLALFARSLGVRAPVVRAVGRAPAGEVLLVTDELVGTSLSEVDESALTDEVLDDAWRQVALLRRARVAHRSLSLGALALDDGGRVHVTGFSRGEIGADDGVLAGDAAELVAGTYARVGAERAVAAGVRTLGREPMTEAIARLVPPALSAPTRAAVKQAEGGLDPLVAEMCRVLEVEKPRFADVERVKPRVLVMAALLVVAVYALAPQLTDLPGMLGTVREADLAWIPAVLLASLATYVGAALGLAGGTPGRIPVGEAGAVALASSFVATFSPPGVGQVGLNVRYLQKRGFAAPVAVSASAAKEAAVLLVHISLLLVFALWAGRSGVLEDELARLPPAATIAVIGGVVLAVIGVLLAIPRVRQALRQAVVPAVRASWVAMREVLTSPAKLVTLLAGVSLLPMGYAACLYFSVQAFGGGASFATIALVSLTAGTIATAAPTPGGVGAVEAVLLAALTAVGIASAPALAAVFLYRLATFWLPIAPGALAFRTLTRREVL